MIKRICLIICIALMLVSLSGCSSGLPKGHGSIRCSNIGSGMSFNDVDFEYINETTVKVTIEDGSVFYIPTTSIDYISVQDKK